MGEQTCKRIAMWSGPRNISTAMMRAFENRADCAVVDEPLYAAYLHTTGLDHPAREAVIASQATDWKVVAGELTGDTPAPVYYQKHMTQHLLPDMDLGFTDHLSNCFLIRDPRRIIASYARVRPSFRIEELGFPQQWELFQRVAERTGEVPPVLDAALTLANPRVVLTALCERLELPFDEGMLAWPEGARDSDGVWAPHWYAAVWASTGFAAPEDTSDGGEPPRLSAEQEAICAQAMESYTAMRAHALSPDGDAEGG